MERNHENFHRFIKEYWEYYRELEDDFLSTKKYVDFQRGNFPAYSLEFLKLFQAVCSEIDVIGKAMAKDANLDFKPEDKQNNILKWWYEIQDKFYFQPDEDSSKVKHVVLKDARVLLLDEIVFQPWENFTVEYRKNKKGVLYPASVAGSRTPDWWKAYNSVKHNRTMASGSDAERSNYTLANFKNLGNAFAALFILESSFMEAVGPSEDLEKFRDISKCFQKEELTSNDDIRRMFDNHT